MNRAEAVYRGWLDERISLGMNEPTQLTDTTTNWNVDPIHTTVGFSIRHLMVTNVRGDFEKVSGTVRYAGERPTAVEIDIDATSVRTRDPQRDTHLRSADFFDVEHHPSITFRSSKVATRPEGSLDVTGALTIRGISREVVLRVDEVSEVHADLQGKPRFGASAHTKIKRSEFGINFNKVLEAGGFALADEVTIQLDVALVKEAANHA